MLIGLVYEEHVSFGTRENGSFSQRRYRVDKEIDDVAEQTKEDREPTRDNREIISRSIDQIDLYDVNQHQSHEH